jgi:transcriptional regulator with XRE-family HTH domain
MTLKVSSAQIRAARGLLHWTVRELAEKAGVHRNTITRMEADAVTHGPTIAAIVRALEDGGVEFIDGERPGVRVAVSPKR